MSGRFGQREPGCECDFNFTCRVCLVAAANRVVRFGVHQPTPTNNNQEEAMPTTPEMSPFIEAAGRAIGELPRAGHEDYCGRSCWIEFPPTVDANAAASTLLATYPGLVAVNEMGLEDALNAIIAGTAAEIYFGLACDVGDDLETEFIAAAEALGGTYTGT